jgi:hypothetical protein
MLEALILMFIKWYFPPIDCTYVSISIVKGGKKGKGVTGDSDAAFHHGAAAVAVEHHVTGAGVAPLHGESRAKGLGDAVGGAEDGEGACRREDGEHGGPRDDEQVKDEELHQSGEKDAQQQGREEAMAKGHHGESIADFSVM